MQPELQYSSAFLSASKKNVHSLVFELGWVKYQESIASPTATMKGLGAAAVTVTDAKCDGVRPATTKQHSVDGGSSHSKRDPMGGKLLV